MRELEVLIGFLKRDNIIQSVDAGFSFTAGYDSPMKMFNRRWRLKLPNVSRKIKSSDSSVIFCFIKMQKDEVAICLRCKFFFRKLWRKFHRNTNSLCIFWYRNEVWLKIQDNKADGDVTKTVEVSEENVLASNVDVHHDDVTVQTKWRHSPVKKRS